jgi:large subunit ribosomal protein L23
MDAYRIVKRALVTEKSTIERDQNNKYVFEVDRRANKIEVGKAIEKAFNVKVLEVRVMNVPGKKKRVGKIIGEKRAWKKAIITLAPESRIEIFEGV